MITKKIKDYLLDKIRVNRFKKFNRKTFTEKRNNSKKKFLVEFNGFPSSHFYFALISNFFKKKNSCSIHAFDNHFLGASNLNESLTSKIKWFIGAKLNINFFGIYKSFGVQDFIKPKFDDVEIESIKKFKHIYSKINSKEDILRISINDILIGDLLYDGYIKSTKEFTINYKSENFKIYLQGFIKLFLFWENYFQKNDVVGVICAHGYYVDGLILRIAIHKNIKSLVMESGQLFNLSKKRYLPHLEWKDYKVIFDKLSPTKKNLLKEKTIESLENRFNKSLTTNKIDEIVSTRSAYSNNYNANKHVLNKNEKIKVLIATHNIQDVYNAYGENFFCDFYEWLHFLGKISNSTNYEWYIKNHPYYSDIKYSWALDYTYLFSDQILNKYKNIKKIPENTSHHQIINEGIDFVLTVYGTISWEYAYHGVPVLTATKNHRTANYNFNINSNNLDEYKKKLLNLDKIKYQRDQNEIIEFYSMRYIFNSHDGLLKIFSNFLNNEKYTFDHYDSTHFYEYLVNNLNNEHIKDMNLTLDKFFNSSDYMLSDLHNGNN
jgi:hypothetical protein